MTNGINYQDSTPEWNVHELSIKAQVLPNGWKAVWWTFLAAAFGRKLKLITEDINLSIKTSVSEDGTVYISRVTATTASESKESVKSNKAEQVTA